LKLCLNDLENIKNTLNGKVHVPAYDVKKVTENTMKTPKWVHFGAGNIFRAFIGKMQQTLLEKGLEDTGIIVAESFDTEIIDKVYTPYDNLTMLVTLFKDGQFKDEVIGSIVETVKTEDQKRLYELAEAPSLQMISFTITEKGYALKNPAKEYFGVIEEDFKNGPEKAKHVMSIVTSMLYRRYQHGEMPVSLVSMDNCSGNGDKIREAVLDIAQHWIQNGFAEAEFMNYVSDENKVAYPISMIDKITPRPADVIKEHLEGLGFEGMDTVLTSRNTYTAPFVNAEAPEYFVVEDKFPNGRPELQEAGVYITDRENEGYYMS